MSPPRAAATAPRGIRLHRSRSLDAQDTTRHDGIPVTSVSRTLLDLAATARPSLRKAGLPEPQTNDAFDAPDHGHCDPDYHWPSHQVIVETDGFETHGTRSAFRKDRAKDAALTASGYRVLRFTRDDDPKQAIKRLRALLA
jgi:uncharacterized protein DUF559